MAYDVVTKANLQYYDGKLKREISKKGEFKHDKIWNSSNIYHQFNENTGELEWFSASGYGRSPIFDLAAEETATQSTNPKTLRRIVELGMNPVDNVLDIEDNTDSVSIHQYGGSYNNQANIPKKEYVDNLFATISSLKMEMVDETMFSSLEEFLNTDSWEMESQMNFKQAVISKNDTIYLFKVGTEYYEYIPFINPPGGNPNPPPLLEWEFVGSTKQDLSGYVKEVDVPETDNDYIDGMFIRNLNSGLYDSSYNQLASWTELVSGEYLTISNNLILVDNNQTLFNENFSTGTILVIDGAIDQIVNSNENNEKALQGLINLTTIYIKHGSAMINHSSDSLHGPFHGCNNLRVLYYRGNSSRQNMSVPDTTKIYAI